MDSADGFDALIRAALHEIIREDWEEIVSDPEITPVSRRFRRRIEGILAGRRAAGRSRRVARKVIVGFLAALCAAAMLGMAIPPVREAVIRTVFTWYDTHFGVRYETEEPVPTIVEDVILPAWLPDGWTIRELSVSIAMADHILAGESGERIHLTQHPIDPDEETDWFDNTDVTIETVLLNGTTEARLFSYADGSCILTWVDRYAFILTWVSESADTDTLIRIAESMNQPGPDRNKS